MTIALRPHSLGALLVTLGRLVARGWPWALVLMLLAGAWPTAVSGQEGRPNFVLLMSDDQGWGDVGYRDHPVLKTPVLDTMANTALRLERFYAAAPVCSPTRGSVLTGRHPNRFGCFSWGHTLRPREVTLAEVLQAAGYRTGHFGKWHVGDVHPDSPTSPGAFGFDEWVSAPNFYENDPLFSHSGRVIETQGEGSEVTIGFARDFIREAHQQEKPFLAVVWFGSPHLPHVALPDDLALYEDQPRPKAHFYGELTAMDRAIGQLRDELRELDIADNTVVWFTSDNGALPVGSTGGLSGRKGNLGEGGLRVPTVIEWPARIREPRVSEVVSGTVDIYPTLLELAGARPQHQPPLDGESLVPLIDGTMTERKRPLGFWVHPTGGISTPSHRLLTAMLKQQEAGEPVATNIPRPDPDAPLKQYPTDAFQGPSAWIDGDWKLWRMANNRGQARGYRLYHLGEDPAEQNDLASEQPERVQAMAAELEKWLESVVRSLNGEDYP